MAAKIRCNDEVIILVGKDKGKRGKVKKILFSKKSSNKLIVEGINLVKKHQKPVPSLNQPGGIVEKEAKIDISNVAIFNSILGKADRIGFRIENNKKVRFFKSNNEIIK
ncbi:MAG: 50S ribosomal protein L24 [Arsenophonus sp.]|nr:MAG: 50S ribosomal protein L24 [Arsenophonus sp.]